MNGDKIPSSLGKLSKFVRLGEVQGSPVAIPASGWIDKKYWRQINNILSLHGFAWIRHRQRWEASPAEHA